MSDGSPFERDLQAAREARALTLPDIQHQTRIPVDVLRRFESGQLVGDATYNEVYLKAFLKSYAGAVGVPAADVLAAYERHKQGSYAGELSPGYTPPAGRAGSDVAPDRAPADAAEPPADAVQAPAVPPAQAAPAMPTAGAPRPPAPPPVASVASPVAPSRPPAPIPTARAARAGVPGSGRSFDKNWGAILGLAALAVAVLGVALWWLVFRDAGPERADLPTADVAAIDSVGIGAAASAGPRLQQPIRVTVTASGDGLQGFRVSRDGARAPYWIDPGDSQTFEAQSEVVLWGEGEADFSDALVEFQGLRWTPTPGRPVTLSTETGQRLLDSLAAAR